MKKWLKITFLIAFSACTAVKPYERQYINDPEMQMGKDAGKQFNQYVNSIREGAVPAGGGKKASGGCGCN